MNLLILGSQGFIGSHLISYYLTRGYTITGCDLPEASPTGYVYHKVSVLSADFDTLFTGASFDVCINASGSGNVAYSITHPLSDFEANSLAVSKVLDVIRKYQPLCKYIHISSAAVYGNPKSLPIYEKDVCAPISPYGYHKWISEIICKEYHTLYNLQIAIVRPFSVYGEGQKKQLLWDICHKLQGSDEISLFGTGKESRDFIHVQDLARLIETIIQSGKFSCPIFNGASGNETTIKMIADIFSKYYNGVKNISFTSQVRTGDPINWRADISAALAINYSHSIALEDGICRYIKWFEGIGTGTD